MFSPSFATSSTRSSSNASTALGAFGVHSSEDALGEGLELLVVGHRLGLATDADDRAGLVVDDEADQALGRLPPGALAGGRHPALAQERPRGLDVAARLLERALAVHHPRARAVAELLHQGCTDRRAHWESPSSAPDCRLAPRSSELLIVRLRALRLGRRRLSRTESSASRLRLGLVCVGSSTGRTPEA